MSHTVDIEFADGEYTFALPAPRIDELQRKCGAPGPPVGIGAIFARVIKGCVQIGKEVIMNPGQAEFFSTDLIETIRQGLIGGGRGVVNGEEIKVNEALANKLVENYVLTKPLSDSWSLAAAILGATIMGYDPPKKGSPAAARAKTRKASSTTRSS